MLKQRGSGCWFICTTQSEHPTSAALETVARVSDAAPAAAGRKLCCRSLHLHPLSFHGSFLRQGSHTLHARRLTASLLDDLR